MVLHAAGDNFNLILLNEEMSKKRFVGLLLIGALLFVSQLHSQDEVPLSVAPK